MAKRKKTKKVKEEQDPHASHNLFLENSIEEIRTLKSHGISLTPESTDDPLLKQLESLVSPQEMEVLKECGAFNPTKLTLSEDGKNFIDSKQYQQHVLGGGRHPSVNSRLRPPQPPVPIFAESPGKSSSMALAGELRYLQTVLHPAETRWLVTELACDALEKAPVTHTDISDAVIASIAPSTAQKVAFQADAQYKYTTAQFLQVYMKMRHVVLEHKLMLAGARADGLLLAASPYEFEALRPEDEVPVSAVEALRQMIDMENMLK